MSNYYYPVDGGYVISICGNDSEYFSEFIESRPHIANKALPNIYLLEDIVSIINGYKQYSHLNNHRYAHFVRLNQSYRECYTALAKQLKEFGYEQ